jgi:hypothetical protein
LIPNRHSTAANRFLSDFNYCPSSKWRCGSYKAAFAYLHLIRKHVLLKGLVSCLNRSLLGQFLREICPFKIYSPKYNAASGIIAGELLTGLQLMPHICSMKKSVTFLKGHISLKNWTYCPLFSHNTTSFKRTCFLNRLKVLPDGLYVFNGQHNIPVQLIILP